MSPSDAKKQWARTVKAIAPCAWGDFAGSRSIPQSAECPIAIVFPDEAQPSCAGERAAGQRVIFDLGVRYGIDRADGESYQQFADARSMSVKRRRLPKSLTTSALLGVSALASANDATSTAPVGDPVHGKALYQACAACHSIDENDLGPSIAVSSGAVQAASRITPTRPLSTPPV